MQCYLLVLPLGKIVSIPNRDFDELQLEAAFRETMNKFKFQSLIGILMNCNFDVAYAVVVKLVSIPNRDFDELQ